MKVSEKQLNALKILASSVEQAVEEELGSSSEAKAQAERLAAACRALCVILGNSTEKQRQSAMKKLNVSIACRP